MAGEVKVLTFSEGVTVTSPTQIYAFDNIFINDNGYVYLKGDATTNGSVRLGFVTNGFKAEVRQAGSWNEVSTVVRGL